VADHGNGDEELPAWSLDREAAQAIQIRSPFGLADARDWAWRDSRGAGVRVCVIDSGVDGSHPRVGGIQGAVCFKTGEDGERYVAEDDEGDLFGHGTACAGIIRALAPECEIYSVRTLGRDLTGAGAVLLAGLAWAIDEGYDIINLSLSTTKSQFVPELHELADRAYFKNTLIVAAAHNMPVQSYPWRFPAVLSVGSHSGTDPYEFYVNPDPPVEFVARGVNVDLAWLEHSTIHATGNSFATPHMAGLAALALAKHPGVTPFELKSLLRASANNVRSAA
jgi:subtilisin